MVDPKGENVLSLRVLRWDQGSVQHPYILLKTKRISKKQATTRPGHTRRQVAATGLCEKLLRVYFLQNKSLRHEACSVQTQ